MVYGLWSMVHGLFLSFAKQNFMKPNLYLLLAGLLIISCRNQQKVPDGVTTTPDTISTTPDTVSTASDALFLKCWANAFEEQVTDSILIFRPCATHTFPAARYRNTITFNPNGEVEYSVLADNDAHTMEQGKWFYNVQTKKLMIVDKSNALVHGYEVVEIGEDVLKVKE